MREYGLIGYPLSHSFSQKYFTEKFAKEGIADAVFHAFSIPVIDDLNDVLQRHPNLKGFAITIPYKRTVLPFLTEVSAEVKQMEACNCVKIEDGKLAGYNTDVIGFEKSFTQKLQPHHTKALILGTGGAASAVQFVLEKLQLPYLFVSRTADPAKNTMGYDDINKTVLNEYSIIINCTPLGTYPKTGESPPIPYQYLSPHHYLFDLVYNPPVTKFLQYGINAGAATKNGYDMLVLQAEENWKIWNSSL